MAKYSPVPFELKLRPEGFVFAVDSLFEALLGLHDQRDARGIRYALVTVLVFVVLAKLAGEDYLRGIAQWVAERQQVLAEILGLAKPQAPCYTTYGRILGQAVAVLGGSPYSYFRYEVHLAALNGLQVYDELAAEFAREFGREQPAVEAYRMDDAEVAFFMIGSYATKAKEAVAAEKAAAIAKKGFQHVKLKLGETPELDIARVKAVREAVGPRVGIRVDANQRWSVPDAIRTLRAMK